MIDQVLELAQYAGRAIEARPELELLTQPSTVMVAFRHRGDDAVNIRIHRDLFASGEAVIGRTRVDGAVALKLTLLNPLTTPADIDALLDDDRQRGSLTGSFTVRASPAALRTRPVIQTVLTVPRGFAGRRRRSERTWPAASGAPQPRPVERALGAQARGQPHDERAVLVARELDERAPPAVQPRRRPRAQERGAPDGDGRLGRGERDGTREDEDRHAHRLGLGDAVADAVGRAVLAREAGGGRVAQAGQRAVLRGLDDDDRQRPAGRVRARRRPAGRRADRPGSSPSRPSRCSAAGRRRRRSR